jgi:hypothetical protein
MDMDDVDKHDDDHEYSVELPGGEGGLWRRAEVVDVPGSSMWPASRSFCITNHDTYSKSWKQMG